MASLMTLAPQVMASAGNKTASKHLQQIIKLTFQENLVEIAISRYKYQLARVPVSSCWCLKWRHSSSCQSNAVKAEKNTNQTHRSVGCQERIPRQQTAVKCYVFTGSTLKQRISARHDAWTALRPSNVIFSRQRPQWSAGSPVCLHLFFLFFLVLFVLIVLFCLDEKHVTKKRCRHLSKGARQTAGPDLNLRPRSLMRTIEWGNELSSLWRPRRDQTYI